ncbi:MAG: YaaA family protein [Mycoplasma sp.]|nr:YaaA family protein [Mycoplasma sp.]
MKIIISPAKTFNLNNQIDKSTPRPKYIDIAKQIFKHIRSLSIEQTQQLYKLSNKKTQEVYKMHQEHGANLYYAIEVYAGQVFKQLDLESYDKEWLNENVVILDALYGVIKPFDLISPYRLDFNLKTDFINLKEIWSNKINEYFKDEEEIINLASKEYSQFINKDMTEFDFKGSSNIKIARGKKLHDLIKKK